MFTSSTKLSNGCDSITPLNYPNVKLVENFCQESLTGNSPAFYQIIFDKLRFIKAVLIIGSSNNNFNDSMNWKVAVGNSLSDFTNNKIVASYSDYNFD